MTQVRDPLFQTQELSDLFTCYLFPDNPWGFAEGVLYVYKYDREIFDAAGHALLELRKKFSNEEILEVLGSQHWWMDFAPENADIIEELAYAFEHPTEPARTIWNPQKYFVRLRASTFTDEATANRVVTEVFRAHQQRFEHWVTSDQLRIAAELHFSEAIGTVLLADDTVLEGHVATVVAVHDGENVHIENAFLGVGRPDAHGQLPSAEHDALFQFLAGHLNEEFADEYHDSITEAAADFLAGYDKETVRRALEEFRALRARHGDTEALMDLLAALGNAYRIRAEEQDPLATYLDQLERALEAQLTTSSAS